jgi:ComF family protein
MDLAVITHPCDHCGCELTRPGLCGACIRRPPAYDRVISVYAYAYPVADLVKALKYRQHLTVAREAGRVLAGKVRDSGSALPECIIPVPLHSRRMKDRGFNQALEISRFAAGQLQLKLDYRLLYRNRATEPQFELGPAQRKKNMEGAFSLTGTPDYQHVAIVDDVITTGATANAIAALLKATGVITVELWAYAQAL